MREREEGSEIASAFCCWMPVPMDLSLSDSMAGWMGGLYLLVIERDGVRKTSFLYVKWRVECILFGSWDICCGGIVAKLRLFRIFWL